MEFLSLKREPTFPQTLSSFPPNVRPLSGSVDIPWGIIELVLWRTALQADTYVFGFIRAHLHFVPMYTGYSW